MHSQLQFRMVIAAVYPHYTLQQVLGNMNAEQLHMWSLLPILSHPHPLLTKYVGILS